MLQVHPPNPPDPQPVHAEVTLRDHRRPPPYRHCEPLYVRLSSTRHASSANSHSSGRVSRGSMISSTPNFSAVRNGERTRRSEEHTSELQSLMRISYAVFCLQNKKYKSLTDNIVISNITLPLTENHNTPNVSD